MLISALFAGIIPLLMWMYQKATDTESPENEKLNITIFGVLFVILGVWDIGDSISTYINYFEKYGSNDTSQILANKLAREIVLYLVVIFPVGWNQKSKIKKTFKKIFSPTNSDKKQSYSYERKSSRTQNQPRISRQKETEDKKLYCPSCHAEVNEEDIFCGECRFYDGSGVAQAVQAQHRCRCHRAVHAVRAQLGQRRQSQSKPEHLLAAAAATPHESGGDLQCRGWKCPVQPRCDQPHY